MPYEFTDDMRQISGFGGAYERRCRAMVQAGLEWYAENPDAQPAFDELLEPMNADARGLLATLSAAAPDCTGLMLGGALAHIRRARELGWDAYCALSRERKRLEDASGETKRNEELAEEIRRWVVENGIPESVVR
jgi:hypothetical protein